MKRDPFAVRLQSGKKTAKVVAGPIGNAAKAVTLPLKDTIYYQIDTHGDYVQETN